LFRVALAATPSSVLQNGEATLSYEDYRLGATVEIRGEPQKSAAQKQRHTDVTNCTLKVESLG
jgi:hypothetical protein